MYAVEKFLTEETDITLEEIRLTNFDTETYNIFKEEFNKRYEKLEVKMSVEDQ